MVVFSAVQQNGSEDGGGQDQAAAEQERGGRQADATRHCSSSSVWSRCHCSYQGNTTLHYFIMFYINSAKITILLIINLFSLHPQT